MRNLVGKIGALAAGALAMYYLDPQQGAQRRAALRELLASGVRGPTPGRVSRRRTVRAYHVTPRADPQSDAELRDRIRARLDRLVSHPGALDVSVDNGVVRLSGDVLVREREGLLLQVQQMAGVQKLVNATTAHESAAGIASREQHGDETGAAAASA